MNKAIAILTILIVTLRLAPDAVAQEDIDSIDILRQELYVATDNKQKSEICKEISGRAYDPDTVIKYSQLTLQYIDITDLDGMAGCYSNMGWAYFIQRDFDKSLDKYQRAVALYERRHNFGEAAMTYINIASCYRYNTNYKEMWDNLYRGLNKAKLAHDTANICYAYSEIADVYQSQKMANIAQETLLEALQLAEKTGDYAEMGVYAKQLGSIVSPENTDIEGVKKAKAWAMRAEEYFSKATDLDQYYEAVRYNNYAEIIYCDLTLAKFYYDDRYIDSSQHYIELYDHFANNISPMADYRITSLHIHARQQMYEQKYRQAIETLKKCLKIAQQENFNILSNITYNLLAESYEKIGDYKNALLYLDKFDKEQQSLSGSDAVAQTAAYNARAKVEGEKLKIENQKQLALKEKEEAQREKQRTFAAIVVAASAVIAIVAVIFVFWLIMRNSVKKIAMSNALILTQQITIEGQKKELQETSEKITQSMSYARRIQSATISSNKEIEAIFPDNLVIYKPQEIVSGDWYLAKRTESARYVAVGGSSQHGVPGAMACMLVVDTIKEAASKIPSDSQASPAEILAQVENKVRSSIGAGMEIAISICIIDDNNLMRYAAINNDAIIVRGDTSEILKSSKREDTVVQLIEGDYLFLYSNNTRRMMSSDGNNPETICKSLAMHHTEEQQLAIDTITGGHTQTGDITIVGMGI